jgi:hypothetical protein
VNFAKRTLAAAGVLGLLCLVPVSVRPSSLLADGPGAVFRLNEACGQATSCRSLPGYICSTHNQDHFDFTCNTGCEPIIVPPVDG